MKVKKAIITAAGYGTRFLPATKNVVKELLPIIDKPIILYTIKQCIKSGIEEIIIVTREGNQTIEDYFSPSPELEKHLIKNGKTHEAKVINNIHTQARFTFVKQDLSLPYGNAAPLYSAKHLIGNEPFIYTWGDDVIIGENVGIPEVIDMYNKTGADVVLNCVIEKKERLVKLGVVKYKDEKTGQVESLIEKPTLDQIPSNVASVSPYLFTSKILQFLDPTKATAGKEFIIQDAINKVAKDGKVFANKTKGMWCTNGDPLSYLITTVEVALTVPELKDKFLTYLKQKIS